MTAEACPLHVYPGWAAAPELLGALKLCFAYPPGDNRATGYLWDPADGLAWPQPLAAAGPVLRTRLERLTATRFTLCAFQAYRDGAGCAWHADTPFGAQAIISLGVPRTFAVRRAGGSEERELTVRHGDVVYMPAGFQGPWEHRVPEEDAPGERCSLVFRTKA